MSSEFTKAGNLIFVAGVKLCLLAALFGGGDMALAQVIMPLTASASSYSTGHSPTNLIDGSGLTGSYILAMTANADSGASGMWYSGGSQVAGAWVAFDLGTNCALTGMDFWQMNLTGNLGRDVKNFAMYTSSASNVNDATNFVGNFSLSIGTGSNSEPLQRLLFTNSIAGVRLVKFVIIDDWNGFTSDYVGLGEVRFENNPVITPVSVSASSYYSSDQNPQNLIDGNGMLGNGPVLTQTHDNNVSAQGMWHTSGGMVNGSWVSFDLGAQYTLAAADIWQLNQINNLGRGVKSFAIYTSSNTTDSITNYAGGFSLNIASGTTNEARQFIPFYAANVRRVMFVISNDWNGFINDYVGLSAVRFEGSLPVLSITNSLWGYWKFDDGSGSTAADSSGNGNSGTIYNTTGNAGQWTSGFMGGALHFRGAGSGSDYVSIPNVPSSATNGMTLSAWVEADASQQVGALVGIVENLSQQLTLAPDSVSLSQSSWHNVVMVTSGGSIAVYRDGMLVASGSYDDTFFQAPNTLILGAHTNGSGSLESYWQGNLDEVAFWTRPLQFSEVFKVFAAGENGIAVTQSDSLSFSPPIIVGGAITAGAVQGGDSYVGEPLSLTVNASGYGTLDYRWYKNGLALASPDYPVFNNPSAGFGDAGQYSVMVTDGNGQTATSQPMTVTVNLPQLNIQRAGNSNYLSWPACAPDYQLESAPAVNGPWSLVPNCNTNCTTTLPATNSGGFYRLKLN